MDLSHYDMVAYVDALRRGARWVADRWKERAASACPDNPPRRECSIGYILKPQHHFLAAGAVFLLGLLMSGEAGAQTSANEWSEPSTALSGYMDFHVNKPEHEDATIDFHRFVLLVTHRFSDRIRFVGELELEHAFVEGLEEGGELELEQAYVDFLSRGNSTSAPACCSCQSASSTNGTSRRCTTASSVRSSTRSSSRRRGSRRAPGCMARSDAAGATGRYRGGAAQRGEFSAEEGLREGHQQGTEANIGRAGGTGRLEYVGVRGLTLGASFWSGRSGFEFRPRFDVPVKLGEADARYARGRAGVSRPVRAGRDLERGRTERRARPKHGRQSEHRALPARLLRRSGLPRLVEASSGDVGAFVRYENFDTQYRMPDGYVPLEQFDRDATVFGLTYWPDPDIAVKVDYS